MELSFKFIDDRLNQSLLNLLNSSKARYRVGADNLIYYPPEEEDLIENELISQIRDRVFPSWQIVSCPPDWTKRYRQYMTQNNIPFTEEIIDAELCFLIPGSYDPHSWKLGEAGRKAS